MRFGQYPPWLKHKVELKLRGYKVPQQPKNQLDGCPSSREEMPTRSSASDGKDRDGRGQGRGRARSASPNRRPASSSSTTIRPRSPPGRGTKQEAETTMTMKPTVRLSDTPRIALKSESSPSSRNHSDTPHSAMSAVSIVSRQLGDGHQANDLSRPMDGGGHRTQIPSSRSDASSIFPISLGLRTAFFIFAEPIALSRLTLLIEVCLSL